RPEADQQNIATKAHGAHSENMLTGKTLSQYKGILRTNGNDESAAEGQTFPQCQNIHRRTPAIDLTAQ
ncbi:uncharacterized protein METZ01_LOCUS410635, partial [marine metagenome]